MKLRNFIGYTNEFNQPVKQGKQINFIAHNLCLQNSIVIWENLHNNIKVLTLIDKKEQVMIPKKLSKNSAKHKF